MKYRFSTLLLSLGIIAVLLAWFTERRRYQYRLDDEVEREGAIRSTLSAAFFSNMIYSQLDSLSADEFARKRTGQLLHNVLWLYVHKDNAVVRSILDTPDRKIVKNQAEGVRREAGKSLALLDVSSTEEFANAVRAHGFTDDFFEEFVTGGQLTSELSNFVDVCLEYHTANNIPAAPTPQNN